MNIKEMHYDFKKKLNKIDSQQYRNLKIPEIDWVLNEAAEIFVKYIAEPRKANALGFEINQRTIDDIRSIVVDEDDSEAIAVTDDTATLPTDYWFHLSSHVQMSKGDCSDKRATVFLRQHDDAVRDSPFDDSSFEWRTVNARFYENGIKFIKDSDFTIDEFFMSYIKKMAYMHDAEDFGSSGMYKLPSGDTLSGTQDCELPSGTHREIVDIAVLITTGELESQVSYKFKREKLNFNQF